MNIKDKPRARALFKWQQALWEGPGRHRTRYMVWSADGKHLLGAMMRCRKGWNIYPYTTIGFTDRASEKVYPDRLEASVGLIFYLNRFRYGRARLDQAGIKDWRLPRG